MVTYWAGMLSMARAAGWRKFTGNRDRTQKSTLDSPDMFKFNRIWGHPQIYILSRSSCRKARSRAAADGALTVQCPSLRLGRGSLP